MRKNKNELIASQRISVEWQRQLSSLSRHSIAFSEKGNPTARSNGIFCLPTLQNSYYRDDLGKRRLSTDTSTISDHNDSGRGKDPGSTHNMKLYNTMTECLESLPLSEKSALMKDPESSSRKTLGLGWYTCGPTTYAPAHLGHARTYVCLDILRRVMTVTSQAGSRTTKSSLNTKSDDVRLSATPEPLFVLNITDVDDKTLAAAADAGVDPLQLARKYEREFWRDWDALNCLRPHIVTRVTEHVDSDIVPYIEHLIKEGMAYELIEEEGDDNGGGVYFDVRAYDEKLGHLTKYGKLAPPAASHGIEDIFQSNIKAKNAKNDKDEPISTKLSANQKRDARDFVLWKTRKMGQEALSWSSPWGEGRPGWHIECSAMIQAVQEKFRDSHQFLVHAGGIDLKFPHHTNEIAQSEAYLGVGEWIPHWIHTGHLHIDGLKMSKSLKNFVSIEDFLNDNVSNEMSRDENGTEDKNGIARNFESALESPSDDFRLWCLGLSGSYRGPATFSMARIKEARSVRQKILRFLLEGESWIQSAEKDQKEFSQSSKKWQDEECIFFKATDRAKQRGLSALENDLDGSTFVSELLVITEHGMKYMQRKDRGPAEPLISAIREVRNLLRLVGFTDATTDAGIRTEHSNDRSSQVCEEALVQSLLQFRSIVRNIALDEGSTPGMKKLLALSDDLRDSVLPEIGIQLIDSNKKEVEDSWKFCLPRKPSDDRTESNSMNDGSTSSGSDDLTSISIGEFFKVGQYEKVFSAYSDDGIPTHIADGSEVSKRLLKKLLKKREKHRLRLDKNNN